MSKKKENIDTDPLNRISTMNINEAQKKNLLSFIESKGKLGEIKKEDFERIKEIGHGSHGVVYKVKHKSSGLLMAQKSIRLELKPEICNQIIRELMILHNCNSPYIVGYYGAFQNDGEIFMLMEFMNRGSLETVFTIVKRIPEDKLAKIIHDVVEGLSYLRKALQVIHRDIKPSNILLNNEGEIKMCDFGVSGKLIDSMAQSFVGTRSYMAPERLKGVQYTVRSDVWSLGVLIMELLMGKYPYPHMSEETIDRIMNQDINSVKVDTIPEVNLSIFELLDYIVNDEPPKLSPKYFKPETCDFVDKCLKKDPAARSDLNELLTHPFLTNAKDTKLADWINGLQPNNND